MFLAFKDVKFVRWCTTQASGHFSQDVVHDRINETGVSTGAPGGSVVDSCLMDQG